MTAIHSIEPGVQRKRSWLARENCIRIAFLAVMVQSFATALFLMDAVLDLAPVMEWLHTLYHRYELVNSLSLIVAVVLGAMVFHQLVVDSQRREAMVALARGAMADLVHLRFDEWGLTAAESEVALFSLKGMGINEIATLRKSAPGTVRAQLSHVYMKAGVSSQSGLMSLVVDEFLDLAPSDREAEEYRAVTA